jgi:hypothetical protein
VLGEHDRNDVDRFHGKTSRRQERLMRDRTERTRFESEQRQIFQNGDVRSRPTFVGPSQMWSIEAKSATLVRSAFQRANKIPFDSFQLCLNLPKTIRGGIQLANVRRRCADGGLLVSRRSFDIASAWMDWGGRDLKRAGLDIQGSRTCLNSARLLLSQRQREIWPVMSLRIALVSLDKFRYASARMQCCLHEGDSKLVLGVALSYDWFFYVVYALVSFWFYEAAYIIHVPPWDCPDHW